MNRYQIITDSGCDLPEEMLRQLNVRMVSLNLLFRGQNQDDSVSNNMEALYAALRSGESASTSAVNPEGWKQVMEPVLQQGQDLLVLAFSSGLSTTYQSAVIAAQELTQEYPGRTINVVDTRSASLGQGLLVWYASHLRDTGLDLESVTIWAEEARFNLCHWFTVDDLMYLKRGGRVSAATAVVGSALNIKPIMHMDDDGHLINVGKVRGRKAAIAALADKMAETYWPDENDTVFICHGDCIEDAYDLEELVKERCGVKTVMIGYTGAVIGSHSGPGTLALFFLGEQR